MAECCEPRRGSCAQVSLDVLAVDDDGLVTPQALLDRLAAQLFERQTDRARQVLARVLLARQDLDQLGATGSQALEFVAGDVHRHTRLRAQMVCHNTPDMVSFGGGGGGAALAGPTGIVALVVLVVIVATAWWLFNR